MIIKDIRVYRGRNIYSHRPVIKMVVDIERLDIPTKDIPNFNEKLIKWLPGLSKHSCSYGYEGGFLKRLEEGTYLPHVTEHIILELQNMLGYDIKFGRARNIEGDLYYIIYEYGLEECGIRVGKLAVEMVNKFIQGEEFDLEERLEKIRNIIAEIELGPSTMAIKNEALKARIPVTRVGNGSILRLGYGKYQKMIEGTISQNTSCIAVDIASDKILTKQILKDHGFPVPEGDVAYNEEEAIAIAEEIGYPVAIKPYNGNQGKGVHLNITNREEVSIAYRNAKSYSDLVIVEKHIQGKHYRVLVVGEKVVAVAEKIPAHVIGDGIHTIEELVEMENKNPLRGKGHEKPLTKLTIDTISKMTLKKQGFDLENIPKKGEKVFLRESANLSTGGIAIDKTDDIHPYNIEIAVRAAKAIGLDIAGIDITMEDIKKPLIKENGAIIEINASPGIRMHHYPSKGKPRNVAKAIVDMLFPKGSKATIISEDHLGIDGIETLEDLAFVKALVVEAVKEDGYSVLNADDPMTPYLAQRAKGKIIYFSMYDNNLTVKKHIEKGGIAVYVKDGVIVIANGQIIPVVKIEEIPAALSGKVLYNVENALAAIAASYGVKVPINIIAKGIKTFYCDTTHNPGRFNLFNVGNFRVLVDYGHNIAGIKSVIEAAQKLDANRLIGVIGVPGDRINSSILKVGEICGQGFDFIYIKEDLDLRGRKPGEVAKLLEQGAIKGGIDRKKIKTILKETEALRAAMYNAEAGDLIVVFYEKYQPIIEVIEEFIKNKDLKNIEIKLERA